MNHATENPKALIHLKNCLHVGITGHRDIAAGEIERVKTQLEKVLSQIKTVFTEIHLKSKNISTLFDPDDEPVLRLISPLAEGADRIGAHTALALGYELQCPLPFDREFYKTTFSGTEETNAEFDSLLKKASAVFEISSGNKRNTSQAYADVSAVLIDHSDILIALSDEAPSKFIAGTYATMLQAFNKNIPVVVIPCTREGAKADTHNHDILFRSDRFTRSKDWQHELKRHFMQVLLPEPFNPEKDGSFFPQPDSISLSSGNDSKLPFSPINWLALKSVFSNAAAKASDKYRKRVTWKQLSPVLAYLCLSLAFDWEWAVRLFVACQIIFLLWPIIIIWREAFSRTHRRFLHTRILAELCRLSAFLSPTGYCNVRYRHRAYYRNPHRNTITWFYRVLARHAGLPSGSFSPEVSRLWLSNFLDNFVNVQEKYHLKRRDHSYSRHRLFSKLAFLFFTGGIVCAVFRGLARVYFPMPDCLLSTISSGSLLFPACAVLFASLSVNFNYPTNYSFSNSMCESLELLSANIAELRNKPDLSYSDIRSLCETVDALCMAEISDWADSIYSKPMKLA